MSQQADDYTRLLRRRLHDRLGEKRYGEVLDAILANLEAYALARDGKPVPSPVTGTPRTRQAQRQPRQDPDPDRGTDPMPQPQLDEEARGLLAALLDHVLRQVTGATR